MTGSSVFDYIHQQDHAELAEQLGINLSQSQATHGMAASPGSVASDDGSSSSAPGGTSTPTGLDRPGNMLYHWYKTYGTHDNSLAHEKLKI